MMNAKAIMALAAIAALAPAGIGSADAFYHDSRLQVLSDCVKSKGLESADYIMQLIECRVELHEHDLQIGTFGGLDRG